MYSVDEEAKKDLIRCFDELDLDDDELAREVYNHYEPMMSLLSEEAREGLQLLYPVAFDDERVSKPTSDEIANVTTKLSKSLDKED